MYDLILLFLNKNMENKDGKKEVARLNEIIKDLLRRNAELEQERERDLNLLENKEIKIIELKQQVHQL